MAKPASHCLFFLLLVTLSSSGGTLVGIPYAASAVFRENSPSVVVYRLRISAADASHDPVDLLVGERSVVEGLMVSRSAAVSWLKSHVEVSTKSVTLDGTNMELCKVLRALKSLHSAVRTLQLDNQVKVSVQFPLSFLETLSGDQARQVRKVLNYLRIMESFVAVEARAELLQQGGITMDAFRSRAAAAHPRAQQVSKFVQHRAQILGEVPELDVQVSLMDNVEEEEQMPPMASSRRELADNHSPPATYVTIPAATPITIPSTTAHARDDEHMLHQIALSRRELANEVKSSVRDLIGPPTTIVTVPATPTNPAATPVPIPSTTVPVADPITNPVAAPTTPVVMNPIAPVVTNPVTTPTTPAVTNPVTTYPTPQAGAGSGYVPVIATPPPVFTSPVVAPPVANAPATPGQSWCVTRAGASEYALQSALDYACGIGGADCSQIQLGAGCYNPNTLQNHASFAFNSYYQKNPVASSCDFGGTASIVATNPSTGSCLYATYSASSQPVQTPSTTATNPATTTTTGTPPAMTSSYGSPPSVLNSSTNPASGTTTQVFGSPTPPLTTGISPSSSAALQLQPVTAGILLATLFVMKVMILSF